MSGARCSIGKMSVYREGKPSECSGSLHRVTVKWTERGSKPVEGENPVEAVVCEGHLPAFTELGKREGYKYSIESDTVIESPIAGEREV